MVKTTRLALLLLCSVLAVQVVAEDQVNPKKGPPKVGDEAPDFTLKGSDGKTYKLSKFKGKQAVVVAWYPKALTGG